jgi:hypothetical protein
MTPPAIRLTGMLFSRPLILESALTASAARARVREFTTSRGMPELEAYRRREIIGWRLSKANEDFLFQPEYGESLSVDGARLVGLVESIGSGSRIRGLIVVAPLTRAVMSILILAVVVAAAGMLSEGSESPAKVLAIGSAILGGAVVTVRCNLWWTSRIVAARLRERLEASPQSVERSARSIRIA